MSSPVSQDLQEEQQQRFRGSWVPAIRDPVRFFNYTSSPSGSSPSNKDIRSTAFALEQVADAISTDGESSDHVEFEAKAASQSQARPDELPISAIAARVLADELAADAEAARIKVRTLQRRCPDLSHEQLCERLIFNKCRQAAIVGFCSAGPAMMLPGWGTLASILLGGVADVTLTTKLEIDLALEIAAVYDYGLDDAARRSYLLKVSGLEGLDPDHHVESEDDRVTRQAGERLAVRTTEEVGKRSLLKLVPVIGATAAAGTNVVGVYVIGRRAQLVCAGLGERLGPWRQSVQEFVVPGEITRAMAVQASRVPSQVTIRIAQATTRIGSSARAYVQRTISKSSSLN